jgi:hypothetical protein
MTLALYKKHCENRIFKIVLWFYDVNGLIPGEALEKNTLHPDTEQTGLPFSVSM